MDATPDILLPLLSALGHQLPHLIACAVALGLLWGWARPGTPRTLGLVGAGILLLTALAGGALMTLQMMSVYHPTSAMPALRIYGLLHMVLNLASAAALVLIAHALCKATRTA